MKIIHTADLHLDASLSSYLNADKASERKAELLKNFVRLSDYAVREGVNAILISGDLFDKRNVSRTAKNLVLDTIRLHPEISYFILQGNHDQAVLSEDIKDLENLFLFSENWKSYILSPSVTITGVELHKENANSIYNTLNLSEDTVNIVMLHGQESASAGKKDGELISIQGLQNKSISYLALGHIHKYKREKLSENAVYCYPGTLEAHGFDECGKHGFVLLDIDEEKKTVRDQFVSFAMREMAEVFADVTDAMTTMEVKELIDMSISEAGLSKKDMLKIVLTGEKNADADMDVDLLETLFSNYYMARVYDETAMVVDYKKYLLDQSLKGEFVRLVMNDASLSEEEKATVISYGLKALAKEKIVL